MCERVHDLSTNCIVHFIDDDLRDAVARILFLTAAYAIGITVSDMQLAAVRTTAVYLEKDQCTDTPYIPDPFLPGMRPCLHKHVSDDVEMTRFGNLIYLLSDSATLLFDANPLMAECTRRVLVDKVYKY